MSENSEECSKSVNDFSRKTRRDMLEEWREQRRQSLAQRLLQSSKENCRPVKLPASKQNSENKSSDRKSIGKSLTNVTGKSVKEMESSSGNNFPHHISRSDMIELCKQAQKDKLATRFLDQLKEYNADRRKTIDGMIAHKFSIGSSVQSVKNITGNANAATTKTGLPSDQPKKGTILAGTYRPLDSKRRATIIGESKCILKQATLPPKRIATSQTSSILSARNVQKSIPPKSKAPQMAPARVTIQKTTKPVATNALTKPITVPTAKLDRIPLAKPTLKIPPKVEFKLSHQKTNTSSQLPITKSTVESRIAESNCNKLASGTVGRKTTTVPQVRNARTMGSKIAPIVSKEINKKPTIVSRPAIQNKVQSGKPSIVGGAPAAKGNCNSKSRVSISMMHRMKKQPVHTMAKPNSCVKNAVTDNVGFETPVKTCQSRHGTLYPASGRKSTFKVANPPKVELDELKKRMMDWMKKRGKTPNLFSHYACFGFHASEMKDSSEMIDTRNTSEIIIEESAEHEAAEIDSKNTLKTQDNTCVLTMDEDLETILHEFVRELDEDSLSTDVLSAWLDGLLERFNDKVVKNADYWICRAKIARKLGNGPAATDYISAALATVAEPVKNVIETKKSGKKRVTIAPTPNKLDDDICQSTVYKYALADKSHLHQNFEPGTKHKQEFLLATATPVRRSGRKSMKRAPVSWTPHLPDCVDTLQDIPQDIRPKVLFTPNPRLDISLNCP